MNKNIIVAGLLSSLASPGVLEAQLDPVRDGEELWISYKNKPLKESGTLIMEPETSLLTWEFRTYGPYAEGQVTTTLPFDRPGEVIETAPDFFLLTGSSTITGQGYFVDILLTRGPRSIIVLRTQTYGSFQDPFDPWRVDWNSSEGKLYVRDYVDREVRVASWSGPVSSLPASESGFGTAADSGTLPALGSPGAYYMSARPSEPGVQFVSTDEDHYWGSDTQPHYRLRETAPGIWDVSPEATIDPSYLASVLRLRVYDPHGVTEVGPLHVKGPTDTLGIRDLDTGQVVHQFAHVAAPEWYFTDDSDLSTWTLVPLPAGTFTMGNAYRVESMTQSAAPSAQFHPIVRHGVSTSISVGSNTYRVGRGHVNPFEAEIGNLDFLPSAALQATHPELSRAFTAFLWVAFRRPDGTDPRMPFMGTEVLTEIIGTLGPAPVLLEGFEARARPAFTLGIPLDPNLQGEVLLTQFVVVDNASGLPMVSDIFGTKIL